MTTNDPTLETRRRANGEFGEKLNSAPDAALPVSESAERVASRRAVMESAAKALDEARYWHLTATQSVVTAELEELYPDGGTAYFYRNYDDNEESFVLFNIRNTNGVDSYTSNSTIDSLMENFGLDAGDFLDDAEAIDEDHDANSGSTVSLPFGRV